MEKCGTCKYYKPNSNPNWGVCRRHAPMIVNFVSENYRQAQPSTNAEEWCGEYKIDKDKFVMHLKGTRG